MKYSCRTQIKRYVTFAFKTFKPTLCGSRQYINIGFNLFVKYFERL